MAFSVVDQSCGSDNKLEKLQRHAVTYINDPPGGSIVVLLLAEKLRQIKVEGFTDAGDLCDEEGQMLVSLIAARWPSRVDVLAAFVLLGYRVRPEMMIQMYSENLRWSSGPRRGKLMRAIHDKLEELNAWYESVDGNAHLKAARDGNEMWLKQMFTGGSMNHLLETVDLKGWNILFWAITGRSAAAVEFLLSLRSPSDWTTLSGRNLLHMLVFADNATARVVVQRLRKLKKLDEFINRKDDPIGDGPAYRSRVVSVASTGDQTPLHYAASAGNADVVKVLLDNGAEVDAVDRLGMTALHVAVTHKDLRLVTILLESGARKDLKNVAGQTPEGLALDLGFTL